MAKTITIKFEGEEYTLEFTKDTVRQMENSGFRISDIQTRPMTVLPELFQGAFLANHRRVSQKTIERMYAKIPHKDEFVVALAELYADPINAFMDEPEDDDEGNAMWTVNG